MDHDDNFSIDAPKCCILSKLLQNSELIRHLNTGFDVPQTVNGDSYVIELPCRAVSTCKAKKNILLNHSILITLVQQVRPTHTE